MMDFVSWDDYSIPNWMDIHKIHVPNHQPVILHGEIFQFATLDYQRVSGYMIHVSNQYICIIYNIYIYISIPKRIKKAHLPSPDFRISRATGHPNFWNAVNLEFWPLTNSLGHGTSPVLSTGVIIWVNYNTVFHYPELRPFGDDFPY